jgi:C4-type Zn-finger protein
MSDGTNAEALTEGEHSCPRCRSSHTELQHSASDQDGTLLWEVVHCQDCSFTWRTSEPVDTIDPEKRPAWFGLSKEDLNELRDVLPRSND